MTMINHRGFAMGGAWLCAGFALLVGCSASDASSPPLGETQEALRKPPSQTPRHGRPSSKPEKSRPGHGHGHGHGHCNHPDHEGPGSPGNGSGGSATASGGSATGSGGSSSSAGSASGGASSAGSGSGSGGFGGGTPSICGDGQYGGYEQCDDGNAASGDGCSSLCQLEPNYACDYLGAPCTPVVCGDSNQQSYVLADGTYAYESCDDGNTAAGDGCTAACDVEAGWICEQPGTACRQPVCGDGKQDSWFIPGPGPDAGAGGGSNGGTYYYEECDDGNAASGDGCASTCTTEAGWICSQPGEACRQPVCGDGFVDFIPDVGGASSGGTGSGGSAGGFGGGGPSGSFEGCDDGNTAPGDGCNATCSVEAGWNCDSWQGTCHRTVCGDGFTDYPAEQCDDGNTTPNDGCAHDCTWENQGGYGGYGGGYGGGFGGGSAGVATGGYGGTG